jgi:hypothetical protein
MVRLFCGENMADETKQIDIDDEKIIEYLKGDLEQAASYQDELSADREEWYKRFRCAPYGNEKDGWSKVVAPVIYTNHQARLASMMDIFTDDFFILKSDDPNKASKFQKLIRYQMFRKQDGERKIYDLLFNAGIYRYAVMKVYRKDDYELENEEYPKLNAQQMMKLAMDKTRTITKYDDVTVDIEATDPMGMPIIQQESHYENVKVVRKIVKYAGPYMEALSPWAFGYSQDCVLTDWGGIDGRLVYHHFTLTLNEIRKREKAKLYKEGTYAKCLEIGEGTTPKPVDQLAVENTVDETNEYDTPQDTDDLSKEYQVKECYAKYDIDDDGLLEPCIITIINDEVVAQIIPNPYGRPPFRVGSVIPEPHKVAGISPASILENDAKIQTNLIRMAQDTAAQTTYQNLVTSDPRMQKMLQDRQPFDVILGDPDKVGEVPGKFDINALLKAIELTKGETEEGGGTSRLNQGLEGDSINKTATGISLISRAGDRRSRLEAKILGNSVMAGIIRDFIFINQKWPSDESIKILGEGIEVTPNDLQGLFDIEIDIGVSPSEKQGMAQQVDLFLQFMTQIGLQLGLTDPILIRNAIEKKYALLGLNLENCMIPVEEMKKRMEEAQKNKPQEDWKEFVQMDKLYPQLTRMEQMQILQKMKIQPDPQGQVAGIPQAKDMLAAQVKAQETQTKAQTAMQGLALTANQQRIEQQKNEKDHRVKVAETLINAKQKASNNDRPATN